MIVEIVITVGIILSAIYIFYRSVKKGSQGKCSGCTQAKNGCGGCTHCRNNN